MVECWYSEVCGLNKTYLRFTKKHPTAHHTRLTFWEKCLKIFSPICPNWWSEYWDGGFEVPALSKAGGGGTVWDGGGGADGA